MSHSVTKVSHVTFHRHTLHFIVTQRNLSSHSVTQCAWKAIEWHGTFQIGLAFHIELHGVPWSSIELLCNPLELAGTLWNLVEPGRRLWNILESST